MAPVKAPAKKPRAPRKKFTVTQEQLIAFLENAGNCRLGVLTRLSPFTFPADPAYLWANVVPSSRLRALMGVYGKHVGSQLDCWCSKPEVREACEKPTMPKELLAKLKAFVKGQVPAQEIGAEAP